MTSEEVVAEYRAQRKRRRVCPCPDPACTGGLIRGDERTNEALGITTFTIKCTVCGDAWAYRSNKGRLNARP